MSMDINTYVTEIDDSVIPKWLSAFRPLGMICEIHPNFSFVTHTGVFTF